MKIKTRRTRSLKISEYKQRKGTTKTNASVLEKYRLTSRENEYRRQQKTHQKLDKVDKASVESKDKMDKIQEKLSLLKSTLEKMAIPCLS